MMVICWKSVFIYFCIIIVPVLKVFQLTTLISSRVMAFITILFSFLVTTVIEIQLLNLFIMRNTYLLPIKDYRKSSHTEIRKSVIMSAVIKQSFDYIQFINIHKNKYMTNLFPVISLDIQLYFITIELSHTKLQCFEQKSKLKHFLLKIYKN